MLLLSACGRGVIYEDNHDIANSNFLRFTPENYEVSVKNIDDCYDIYVSITVDTAVFQGNSIPLIVNVHSPNDDSRMFRNTVSLRDKQGNWKGSLDGSKLTSVQLVRHYYFFNVKGKHRVEVGQATHKYDLYGVDAVGLKIMKADLVYPD